ncbi:unnamed protein product [Prunus armeniaca]
MTPCLLHVPVFSFPLPPDYVTGTGIDNHAIEVRSKLHLFAQKNLDENVLHLFDNTRVLAPHWFGLILAEMAKLMKKDAEAPLCFESTSGLASHTWVSKNLSRSFPSSEVRSSPVKWADWIDRLLPRYGAHWRRAGIYDAILLSKQSINRDENLLAAALCFWNSASNTFDFRELKPGESVMPFHYLSSYDQSELLFLKLLEKVQHLAEALHNHIDVGLGTTVLAHLFKNLHTATLENPLNLSAPGAFWMIQVWLLVYFLELRFPDIVLPEDQVLAQPLMSAEVPKRSLEEYLMFFRHYIKRSPTQWQVVIRRTYPWFHPGHWLFEKGPEEEAARIDFRKKFLSVTLPRDLPYGGGKPPNYHLGVEVYHPNLCARQLGCPQLIPLKSYRSCNIGSSWRDVEDLEVHKDARCVVNKINNSADALYPLWQPNSCSSADFDAWWKAKCQDLPHSTAAFRVLFDGWDNWTVFASSEAKEFMMKTIKDINAQVIEDPSLAGNVGGQSIYDGRLEIWSYLPDKKKKKKNNNNNDNKQNRLMLRQPLLPDGKERKLLVLQLQVTFDSFEFFYSLVLSCLAYVLMAYSLFIVAESPSPTPTKSKRLRKRTEVEYVATDGTAADTTTTSGTDEELREAFEAVEQEMELEELEEVGKGPQEKAKTVEIPAEVIAESIALAQRAFPWLRKAEHSTAVPAAGEQSEQSAFEPVDRAGKRVVFAGYGSCSCQPVILTGRTRPVSLTGQKH